MKWEKIRSVLRGARRVQVLTQLTSPSTATLLAKKVGTHRSTVSRVLRFLEERGFVHCLDPDEPFNRYYARTSIGDAVVEELRRMESGK